MPRRRAHGIAHVDTIAATDSATDTGAHLGAQRIAFARAVAVAVAGTLLRAHGAAVCFPNDRAGAAAVDDDGAFRFRGAATIGFDEVLSSGCEFGE